MKKRIVVIATLIGTFISYSQTETEIIKKDSLKIIQKDSIKEPEWTGDAVFLDNQKTIKLEKKKSFIKTSTNAAMAITGIGRIKSKRVVKGNKSPVKINKNKNLIFIFNFGSNTVNPNSIFEIVKLLTNKKNKRYYIDSSNGIIGGEKHNLYESIPFKAVKYGKYSYKIEISNIPNGEYAIIANKSQNWNLFAIENNIKKK